MTSAHNPFATCYTAPGCLPYLASQSPAADIFWTELHAQWGQSGRVGAIVGPHGCGKSTLLAALTNKWHSAYGYRVNRVTLHDGVRALPRGLLERDVFERELLIVDGYEQLGWRARWQLRRWQRRTRAGLLVTSHAEVRLPTLYRVTPSYETLLVVVRHLLRTGSDSEFAERFIARHVAAAWRATGANARETLFQLYDCWESDTLSLEKSADDSNRRDASDSAASFMSSN